MRPVLEDLERGIDDVLTIGGDAQEIDRLVERGRSVHMGTETHAERLEGLHELHLREVLCAVEGHVLDEMGQAELVVVLLH